MPTDHLHRAIALVGDRRSRDDHVALACKRSQRSDGKLRWETPMGNTSPLRSSTRVEQAVRHTESNLVSSRGFEQDKVAVSNRLII
jgi:hypothetical protein